MGVIVNGAINMAQHGNKITLVFKTELEARNFFNGAVVKPSGKN